MGGRLGPRSFATGGAGPARAAGLLAVAATLALTAFPVAGQVPGRGQRPASPDTVAADTVPADTLLTPRERALRRLRAMPTTPVEPPPLDSLAADSLAADSLAADTLAADSLAVQPAAADSAAEIVVADSVPGAPTPDTVGAGRPEDAAEVEDRGVAVREDSVRALLQSLEGYVVTEYRGDAAVFRADSNQLRLTGESRVAREGSALETDSVLVYAGARGVVCGYGNPVLSGEGDPVESDRVCFDINRNLGEAVGARTQFAQGATWYVRGAQNRVYLLTGDDENRLYGDRADFTSCELEDPHYVFRARSLKMVEGDLMVARDVTLRFEDVPVFWLPWMVQSMKRGRRSGLLMPEFGVNDIVRNGSGYNRHLSNLGFYWAINDYLGAQGTFEWYSENWKAVEGALNYHWRRQFLQGSWSARQYWREPPPGSPAGTQGRRDLTVSTRNSWKPDERTSVNLSGSYATSTDFVRQSSFDPRELNRKISSNGSINRSFSWGSMTVGATRNQDIGTERVDLTLPNLNVRVTPLTLFSVGDGGLGLTWDGSATAQRRSVDVQELLYANQRDQDEVDASANHSLRFGKVSLNQTLRYNEQTLGYKPPVPASGDTLADGSPTGEILLEENTRSLDWTTSTGFQQNLWTGTTLSPSLSIGGSQVSNDSTAGELVAAPNRISTGASLTTTIFGFWPGFGNFSRIRHKISPSLSWRYSPAAEPSELQRRVFGDGTLREQNQITLNFNQTFEAKVAAEDTATEAEQDTLAEATGAPGEPRRLPQDRKVMLLALNTSGNFVYDFVAAREEGRGFMPSSDRVTNSIRSDLLPDFTLNMSHDLFDEDPDTIDDGRAPPRRFAPFLTSVNASFRIDDDFWLFRTLGLTSPEAQDPEEDLAEGAGGAEDPTLEGEMDPEQAPGARGIVPGRGAGMESGVRRGIGGWQASLSYSLDRFRPSETAARRETEQTLSGNMSFQPTEHWSLRWSTSYSFTAGEFSSHVLTLTRDLHRWQANFDFIKAQNGNFLFSFRVQLTDNPDLKVDYDQRTDPSDRLRVQPPPTEQEQ